MRVKYRLQYRDLRNKLQDKIANIASRIIVSKRFILKAKAIVQENHATIR